jgi:hypothetical protein
LQSFQLFPAGFGAGLGLVGGHTPDAETALVLVRQAAFEIFDRQIPRGCHGKCRQQTAGKQAAIYSFKEFVIYSHTAIMCSKK